MDNNSTWLETSLFAEKSQWGCVLRNGIKAFIEQSSIATITEALMIEFNYTRGENIRFAIKIPIQNAGMIADDIDNFFKSFFSKANLSKKEITLPVQGIFLPFPANTIQYGLYNRLPTSSSIANKITSKTSDCIIKALMNNDLVYEETLIMLAFYFHCALITQAKETAEHEFINIYRSEIHSNSNVVITEQYLLKKYQENKTCLMEIEGNIRNYQSAQYSDNPSWLVEWMVTCKEALVAQLAENNNIIINIQNSINRQLGLTNSMIKLVHYFVKSIYAD